MVALGLAVATLLATAAEESGASLLSPVPAWTRVEDYLVGKELRTVRVPEIESLTKHNCWRAKQCAKYCRCPDAAGLPGGSPECCVWSATALDVEPLGERGCLIDVRFGEVSREDFETRKAMQESGTTHPMADLILGAAGDDTESFGVHGRSLPEFRLRSLRLIRLPMLRGDRPGALQRDRARRAGVFLRRRGWGGWNSTAHDRGVQLRR